MKVGSKAVHWTEELFAKLLALKAEGKTHAEIAVLMNRTLIAINQASIKAKDPERSKRNYRNWKEENRDIQSLRRKQFRKRKNQEKRAFVTSFKKAPCQDCGDRFAPICMDFDHRESATKFHDVSYLVGCAEFSLEQVKAEIEKCDLVCANCHRIRTWSGNLEKDFLTASGIEGVLDYQI